MGKDKRSWRKLVKKLRRKRIRSKLAIERKQVEDVENVDVDDAMDVMEEDAVAPTPPFFITKEEWTNREKHSEMVNAMRQAEDERIAKTRADEEKRIREEWEEKERKEKADREEKERLETERRKKQDEEYNQFLDFLCGDIETLPQHYVMPEGYDETGKEACHQFLKTGACRYFERCKLLHPSPTLSRIIMIPNFFSHFLLQESLRDEYDTDIGLEYEHSELHKQFLEFYEDVLPEFQKHGKVIQFKVCCNFEPHLRGNVYVQFENIRSAVEAYRTFNGRFYNGRQISLQFVKIDAWKVAICWSFLRRHCLKGRNCNYLHVFRNPTKEFVLADRDWKELPAFNTPQRGQHSTPKSASTANDTPRRIQNHPEKSSRRSRSLEKRERSHSSRRSRSPRKEYLTKSRTSSLTHTDRKNYERSHKSTSPIDKASSKTHHKNKSKESKDSSSKDSKKKKKHKHKKKKSKKSKTKNKDKDKCD